MPRGRGLAPDATALVQFTSGASGTPRALSLTRCEVEAKIATLRASLPDTGWDSVGRLPLWHDLGLIANLLVPMTAQWEHALMRPELVPAPLQTKAALTVVGP